MVECGTAGSVRVVESGVVRDPPVILLHGWGASAYGFRHLFPLLERAQLRGIAPDLRGHGLSDKPLDRGRYTATEMTQHVLAAMDHLEIDRAVVAGQSMGGAIALDIAREAPHRVRGVLLLAPVGLTRIRRVQVARVLGARSWHPTRLPRVAVALLLRRIYGTRASWTDRDVDEYWAPTQFPANLEALVALVERFDWTPRAPTAGPPMMALLGRRDKLIDPDLALKSLAQFGRATARVLDDVGHLPAEEAAADVAAGIVELIGKTA